MVALTFSPHSTVAIVLLDWDALVFVLGFVKFDFGTGHAGGARSNANASFQNTLSRACRNQAALHAINPAKRHNEYMVSIHGETQIRRMAALGGRKSSCAEVSYEMHD